MPAKKERPSREVLERLYCVEGKSADVVGVELGCSKHTVLGWLRSYGITVRRPGHRRQAPTMTTADLKRLYVDESLTITQIAALFDTSTFTVWRRLAACGIEKRGVGRRSKVGGTLFGTLWSEICKCARRRGITVLTTMEDAYDLLLDQDSCCTLTGRVLHVAANSEEWVARETTASLDRIDSGQGYVPGNLQWVDKRVQMMKGPLPQDEFVQICREVADHSRAA